MNESVTGFNSPVNASLWRILVDPIEIKTHTDGGFELPRQTIEAQEYLRYVGRVVDIGPLCFMKPDFVGPDGAYVRPCEVGDWIVYGRHAGLEIFVQDGENIRRLRVINDDQVMTRVNDIDRVKIPL